MSRASVSGLIRKPHHTALSVEDFAAARDFFTGLLGFTLEDEMDDRDEPGLGRVVGLEGACVRWAMLERQGYRIELFKYHRPEGRPHGNRQSDRGWTHIAFEVDDVDAVHAKLEEAGVGTVAPPTELRGGRSKVIYAYGPEGSIVEFLELSA